LKHIVSWIFSLQIHSIMKVHISSKMRPLKTRQLIDIFVKFS
jgi:hypothetical protein